MALIFFLSAQPNLRVSDEAGLDFVLRKIGHMVVFGVLAVLLFEALGDRRRRRVAFAFGLTVLLRRQRRVAPGIRGRSRAGGHRRRHRRGRRGRGPRDLDAPAGTKLNSNDASGTLAAFRAPGYGPLWLSSATAAFGHAVSVVAIGWATLQVSDSALAVGAAFAARLIPSLLLGIPIGAYVDRVDRGRLLVAVNVAGVVPLVAAAALIGSTSTSADVTLLLVLSLALGLVDTVRGLTTTAYAFDLAGPSGATNAIALANLGGFLLGVGGSLAGGVVLERAGPAGTLLLAGVATGLAAVLLAPALGRSPRRAPRAGTAPSARRSLTLITRNRTVALLALIVVVGEIFGFAAATLFPTFARDVLDSDASGLGVLLASRYIGSIIVLLLVARLAHRASGGGLVLFTTFALGACLVGFALSTAFLLSAFLLLLVGMASAAVDSLIQSRIQHAVDDTERGAAVGVWYFAVGFGPIGNLLLGAAAAAIGAPLALAISGSILALFALALGIPKRVRAAL